MKFLRMKMNDKIFVFVHFISLSLIPLPAYGRSYSCSDAPNTGNGQQLIPSYYYDASTRKCESFTFTGNGGNDNRYHSLSHCLRHCASSQAPAPSCDAPADPGNGDKQLVHYYYNTFTTRCEPFVYSGFGGNGNMYKTFRECSGNCSRIHSASSQHVCNLIPDPGIGAQRILYYYFNNYTGKCERFTYTGLGGNDNRYSSLAECKKSCINNEPSQAGENSCALPADFGFGSLTIPAYFYNVHSQQCESFIYSGFGGNSNKYRTSLECIVKCRNPQIKAPSCHEPADSGVGSEQILAFYYNFENNVCEAFLYAGYGGNGNRYSSLQECRNNCTAQQPKDPLCNLRLDPGFGNQQIPLFYYNSYSLKCETFVFLGFGGNNNRFANLGLCQKACNSV